MSATLSADHPESSYSASSSGRLTHGAAMAITQRLSELPDLPLPSSLYKDESQPPVTASALAYLQALLQKDPAAFLARYGGLLQSQELNHFEALRSADWEVNHWLTHFAAQRMAAAQQAADPRRLPARVKNRRLAAMRRLVAEGEYFSDDAMRHRAPLLFHQHIGCFAEQEQEQQRLERERQEQGEQGQARGEEAAHDGQQQPDVQMDTEGGGAGPARAAINLGQHGAACSRPGQAGGVGGSCLAEALQRALARHEERGPAASRAADPRPAPAAAELAGTAAALAGASDGRQWGSGDGSGAGLAADMGPSTSGKAAHGHGPGPMAGEHGRAGPAEMLFSEFLMRQDDEAQLVMRRIQEQREEDAQFSEHESDEEESEEGDGSGHAAMANGLDGRARSNAHAQPTASELAQMRRDFVSEMESRFLLGQDAEYVDYSAIDADASLDADWIEQESRDAEDRYFDED